MGSRHAGEPEPPQLAVAHGIGDAWRVIRAERLQPHAMSLEHHRNDLLHTRLSTEG
jgi:hypothetical protein